MVKCICIHKYKIRQDPLPNYYDVENEIKKFYTTEKSRGYIIDTQAAIKIKVISLIKSALKS